MRLVLPVVLCAALATPAIADPLEDLGNWYTALSLDELCHVLKYSERAEVEEFISDALGQTSQYIDQRDGRMTQADYFKWYDGVRADAASEAGGIGCTTAAQPYLAAARNNASAAIYQGLYLSIQFDRVPEEDLWRIPLTPGEVDAANRYDTLLQQIYGAQFPAFSEMVKNATAARLPGSIDLNQLSEWGFGLVPDEEQDKLWAAQALATGVMRNVYFEVTAELNSWRVSPAVVQKGWTLPSLVLPNGSTDPHVIWYGPETVPTATGEKVNLIITRTSDSHIRVMTYGDVAQDTLKSGIARLYVLKTPQPEGASGWELLTTPAWPDLVTVFEGTLLDEPCLGGPCFDFPPEASDAILSGTRNDYSELFLAADAAAAPDFSKRAYQRGAISNFLLWKAAGW